MEINFLQFPQNSANNFVTTKLSANNNCIKKQDMLKIKAILS